MFVNCWIESQRFFTGGSPVPLSSVKNLGNEVAEEKIVSSKLSQFKMRILHAFFHIFLLT